ncbi:MAG TPA: GDP-mannose 4,6-dehydratase [Thermoanaerobaculia bacterium]|nr:GDP-mannose 4,6-dehydratase [Thermoanaerobaculia bacterium]
MRFLITGIGGFVGSRLARHLLDRGDRVSGTYLDAVPDLPGVDLHEADLTDRAAMERVVRETAPDAVFNMAGLSHVGESWNWELLPGYYWVNVVGTENVVAAAAGRPVVVISSADVYGLVPEAEQPISEDRKIAPQSPYAITKAASERIALAHGALVVRSFNLIGPGQAAKFALANWATQLAAIRRGEREAVLEVGNLESRRDFVHVDDGAAAYRLLVERGAPGTVYNLASGRAVSMREALTRLLRVSGVEVQVKEGAFPPRPQDIPMLSGDASRLRALGWKPEKTLDDALSDLWRSVS